MFRHEFFYALFDSGLEKVMYGKRRVALLKATKQPSTPPLSELLPAAFNMTYLKVR